MGDLFRKDTTLFRSYFKEQAKLLGVKVLYRYPIDMEYTIHSTENPLGYSEPIEMDIIFDSSPKLRTMKRLGWVSESPDDKPYLAQLPFDSPNLQKGCLIDLPVPDPLTRSKTFRVTDIQVDQIFPDSYYCKLVPKFEEITLTKKDYADNSYSFLKVDEYAD